MTELFEKGVDLISKYGTITEETEITSVPKVRSSINTLLGLVNPYGQKLGNKWVNILKCASQLAEYSLYVTTHKDGRYFGASQSEAPKKKKWFGKSEESNQQADEIKRNIAQELFSDFDIEIIEPIYLNSHRLNGDAIVDFVKALTEVSLEELKSSDEADEELMEKKRFSMQKVLEVADANMNTRSRLEWSRIWNKISVYFDTVACIQNQTVSMFALDSLKQLSFKFLEKEELDNFHFQKLFLKPFEVIIVKSHNTAIKTLVLQVVEYIIYSSPDKLASGWTTLLNVISLGAQDNEAKIVESSFCIFSKILKDFYKKIVFSNFLSYNDCLCSFSLCNVEEYRKFAIDQYTLLKNIIISGELVKKEDENFEYYDIIEEHLAILKPFFSDIITMINCSVNLIPEQSLKLLFDILKDNSFHVSKRLWKVLFSHLLSLFDNVNINYNGIFIGDERLSLLIRILQNIVDLFINKTDELLCLFTDILDLFSLILKQCMILYLANQPLARSGIDEFNILLLKIGSKLSSEQWTILINKFSDILSFITPSELLDDIVLQKNQVPIFEKVMGDNIKGLSKGLIIDVFYYIY